MTTLGVGMIRRLFASLTAVPLRNQFNCCTGGDRLSTTNNNANKQWNLQTAVNLTSASASPASKALPIATIAAGGVQTLAGADTRNG